MKKRTRKIIKKKVIKKSNHSYTSRPIIEHSCDRDVYKITNDIFYHMFCINDSLERFERTYQKIARSGLLDHINNIYVNCVGDKKIKNKNQISNFSKVIANVGEYDKGEAETLNILRDFCIENPHGNVLYLHSKGVSIQPHHKDRDNIQNWIDCMEYFLIEEYQKCFSILQEYDNCGLFFNAINKWYKPSNKTSAYCGNFWWSRNCYVSQLALCSTMNRWCAEVLFLRPALSKYKNLYSYSNDLYKNSPKRDEYTKKQPLI